MNNTPGKKETGKKILKAARKIFSEHPYHAASIRMIGKEGNIDHPLINYYFPTKAGLFEAVIDEIAEEYGREIAGWYKGIDRISVPEGFSTFLNRSMAYHINHPEISRIIILNMIQPNGKVVTPGYDRLQELFAYSSKLLRKNAKLRASDKDVVMYVKSYGVMINNLMGGRGYYAANLGLNPESETYFKWVKETMTFLFLPRLQKLVHP